MAPLLNKSEQVARKTDSTQLKGQLGCAWPIPMLACQHSYSTNKAWLFNCSSNETNEGMRRDPAVYRHNDPIKMDPPYPK
jgi:hypothetical protein